jgi:hypothetical protein
MGLDMSMQVDDPCVARGILNGYKRSRCRNWSTVAISAGRKWNAREHAGLVTFVINAFELGASASSGGFTLFSHSDATEAKVVRNMDHYMTEMSDEYHIIAYWCKDPHIHAWFDAFVYERAGYHITSTVGFEADVLHKLRDEIQPVLDAADTKGAEAAYRAMRTHFPLSGAEWEAFSGHTYTPRHVDELRETALFLDNLFSVNGTEQATYYYTATW